MTGCIISPSELANTYSASSYTGSHKNAWDYVNEYQQVMQYHRDNREKSPYQIQKELGVPRKRVRGWIEGKEPDPVRALNIADENGWLDATWDSEIGRAFNILVAWIYSSGSIDARDLYPIFIVDSEKLERLIRKTLDVVGYGATLQHQNDPNRATQIVPSGDRVPVLARALSALGAPIGKKSAIETLALPAYLESAPDSVRREFVELYVTLRGSKQEDRDGLELSEKRSEKYHQDLADLIESVGGGSVTPLSSQDGLWLSAEAVSNLNLDPSW